MLGIFKSAETKRRERERDETIASINNNISGAASEITHLERSLVARRQQAAKALRHYVLACDRSADAVEAFKPQIERLVASPSTQGTALGMMMATRMVLSGVLVERLEGSEFLAACLHLAKLQGLLEGFMQRQGVRGWGVHYPETSRFEAYRREYIKSLSEANGAGGP
jgi:hypothetical protein